MSFAEAQDQTNIYFQNDSIHPLNEKYVGEGTHGIDSSLDEAKRYIVKLAEPSSKSNSTARVSRSRSIGEQHKKFRDDLTKLQKTDASGRSASHVKILHEYKNVYNGFAIQVNESTKHDIKKLSYVEEIFEDRIVKATDISSSKLIHADQVWNDLQVTGKNVSIGIIDTGIDYTHRDLGRGFGNGFKVKGGYDFVNNDNDPFDDNGHGTHVAGIAAGNGPGLKGVAPDANLYACKVLNDKGVGYDSWILAAIEWVLDPDQDSTTNDRLDVINMSLGRPSAEIDPLVDAVNNAVKQGITFVISSGNSGDYGTVGSPGVSSESITVAATDDNDSTAYFSSKGPTNKTLLMKPDVGAPGVKIYSSIPNNAYANYNGTSMAAPHVAGAAALLLEKNPTWTPEIIKGSLMSTAVNTNNELVWNQGSGRIDVRKAIDASCVFFPASISLASGDSILSEWVEKQSITLINTGQTSKTFQLKVQGENFGTGIEVKITPEIVTIPAGGRQSIEVLFTIDLLNLPFKSFPTPYSGFIEAVSGETSVKASYAFIHSRQTNFNFIGELPTRLFIIGIDGFKFYKTVAPTTSLMLPEGTFDIIAYYYKGRYVIREGITSGSSDTVSFDKAEAKNKIVFNPLDKDGKDLPIGPNTLGSTLITGIDRKFMIYHSTPLDSLYISDVKTYSVDMLYFDKNEEDPSTYYDITNSTGYGISSSASLINDPEKFTDLNLENPGVNINAKQSLTYYIKTTFNVTLKNTVPLTVINPLHILHTRNSTKNIIGKIARLSPEVGTEGYSWETQVFSVDDSSALNFSDFAGNKFDSLKNIESYHYKLGSSIPYMNARMNNSADQVVISDDFKFGIFNRTHGERETGIVHVDLLKNNESVYTTTIPNRTLADFKSQKPNPDNLIIPAVEGVYTLNLDYYDYKLPDLFSKINARLTFDTRLPDKNPPAIKYFSLESDGTSVNKIEQGSSANLKFSIKDCDSVGCRLAISNVALKMKNADSTEWINLQLVNSGDDNYSCPIPLTISNGHYDLKLFAQDESLNAMEYLISPGFLVGNAVEIPYQQVTLLEPMNGVATLRTPFFRWSDIQEATSYTLQLSTNEKFDSAMFHQVDTCLLNFTTLLEPNTNYYWKVKANYDELSSRWSEVSTFTTGSEEWKKVDLIFPSNEANVFPDVTFSWTDETVDTYLFQISKDNAFDTLLKESVTPDTTISLNLPFGKQYYWRVKPETENSEWSAVNTFMVQVPELTLLSPANDTTNLDLNLIFEWTEVKAVNYHVYISEDSAFSTILIDAIIPDTVYTVDRLSPNKEYYWKIMASYVDTVVVSVIYKFSTRENIVQLLNPSTNTRDLALSLQFSWTHAIEGKDYLFQLATDSTFLNSEISLNINDTTTSISGLYPGQKYFWRVIPVSDNASWSDVNYFYTLTPEVNLISPVQGEENVPMTAELHWEPVEGALNYSIDISNDNTLKTLDFNAVVTTNTFTVEDLEPTTTYHWKIGANYATGTIWSEERTFSTVIITPVERLNPTGITAYPNPSSGQTTIKFYIAKPTRTILDITNAEGATVYTEDFGVIEGERTVLWQGNDKSNSFVAEGLYVVLIKTQTFITPLKIIVRR